jgi:sphinganine-1-phosphate aldolase
MYRDADLRQYQYFVSVRWVGGIYASPTLAGSRPGALSAATWTAMMSMGRKGYENAAFEIMQAAHVIRDGVNLIPGLRVIGHSELSVVAFGCDVDEGLIQQHGESERRDGEINENGVNKEAQMGEDLNIYKIDQALAERGWSLSQLQYPNCLHICCTFLHRGERAQQFLADLRAAVQDVRAQPDRFAEGSAAIYGMSQRIPDATLIEPLAKSFVDALFLP